MWPFRGKRGRALLRPYELAVIDALRGALPPKAASLYGRQIDAVEKVSRNYEDAEVIFGPKGSGLERFDATLAFENRRLEYELATVSVNGSSAKGKVTVTVILGHACFYNFRPSPRRLGAKNGLTVTKVKVRIDPTKPDDGSADRQRLAGLAPAIRSELELIWADRPTWAACIVEPGGAYRIDLEDGAYLMLAQLEDTTFVVAGVDPARAGVRRYDTEGGLLGEYRTVMEAIAALPGD